MSTPKAEYTHFLFWQPHHFLQKLADFLRHQPNFLFCLSVYHSFFCKSNFLNFHFRFSFAAFFFFFSYFAILCFAQFIFRAIPSVFSLLFFLVIDFLSIIIAYPVAKNRFVLFLRQALSASFPFFRHIIIPAFIRLCQTSYRPIP